MKTHNRVKQTNGIDPQIQRTINRLVIANLERLDLSPAQRAAIAVALLAPALEAAALKRRNPKKKFGA
jgi:hypothetical protein